ncbi:hypothetical protein KIPB_002261, partial [Kipferlia bialata]
SCLIHRLVLSAPHVDARLRTAVVATLTALAADSGEFISRVMSIPASRIPVHLSLSSALSVSRLTLPFSTFPEAPAPGHFAPLHAAGWVTELVSLAQTADRASVSVDSAPLCPSIVCVAGGVLLEVYDRVDGILCGSIDTPLHASLVEEGAQAVLSLTEALAAGHALTPFPKPLAEALAAVGHALVRALPSHGHMPQMHRLLAAVLRLMAYSLTLTPLSVIAEAVLSGEVDLSLSVPAVSTPASLSLSLPSALVSALAVEQACSRTRTPSEGTLCTKVVQYLSRELGTYATTNATDAPVSLGVGTSALLQHILCLDGVAPSLSPLLLSLDALFETPLAEPIGSAQPMRRYTDVTGLLSLSAAPSACSLSVASHYTQPILSHPLKTPQSSVDAASLGRTLRRCVLLPDTIETPSRAGALAALALQVPHQRLYRKRAHATTYALACLCLAGGAVEYCAEGMAQMQLDETRGAIRAAPSSADGVCVDMLCCGSLSLSLCVCTQGETPSLPPSVVEHLLWAVGAFPAHTPLSLLGACAEKVLSLLSPGTTRTEVQRVRAEVLGSILVALDGMPL